MASGGSSVFGLNTIRSFYKRQELLAFKRTARQHTVVKDAWLSIHPAAAAAAPQIHLSYAGSHAFSMALAQHLKVRRAALV